MQPQDHSTVTVTLHSHWSSGSSEMDSTIEFMARSLDEALRLIRVATDAAPIFKSPEEESNVR